MRTALFVAALPALFAGCLVERTAAPAPAEPKPAPAATEEAPAETPAQRAARLAQEVIIVDGHVDLPFRLWMGRDEAGEITEDVTKRTEKGDFDLVRARAGGLDAPFMSIYTPAANEEYGPPPKFNGPKKLADDLIDLIEALQRRAPDRVAIARTPAEIEANHKKGLISLPLGMENGSPLEGDLANLDHFYRRGVRYITLAHSKDNHLADSSYEQTYKNGGLSEMGKRAVRRMNELGIFVDVSHLSDTAAAQAIALSEAPVIASHSSCRKFTPDFERNISDELIRAVAAKGGVVMINFGSTFLDAQARAQSNKLSDKLKALVKEKGIKAGSDAYMKLRKKFYKDKEIKRSNVAKVVAHLEHVISLVGVEHVGFGSDFDGVGDTLPEGLRDVSQYPNLIAALLARGHSEEDVRKMAGGNVLRAWRAMEATAARLQKEATP